MEKIPSYSNKTDKKKTLKSFYTKDFTKQKADQICENWNKLVYKIYYSNFSSKFSHLKDDLIQEGMIGLIESARDNKADGSFKRFAGKAIQWRMTSFVSSNMFPTRLTQHRKEQFSKISQLIKKTQRAKNRDPELREIQKWLGLKSINSAEKVRNFYAGQKKSYQTENIISCCHDSSLPDPDQITRERNIKEIIMAAREDVLKSNPDYGKRNWDIFLRAIRMNENGEILEKESQRKIGADYNLSHTSVQLIVADIRNIFIYKLKINKSDLAA